MKFLLRHWYNISLVIGILCLIGAVVFWNDLSLLQGLALLNFAVINFHFFEEFGFPGGFPKFANTIFAPKNSTRPERYPLNQLSALVINWLTGIVMYLLPIFFPDAIWLGLGAVIFGGVMQLLVHGIYNNIVLKRFYNAGLASVVLGHLPIAIVYIYYITVHHLASGWDWFFGILFIFFWYIVIIRIAIPKLFEDPNSPYAFDEVEMNRFKGVKK